MVQIISEKNIKEYMDRHPEYTECLKAWMTNVKHCTWEKPQDIVDTFGSKAVDILYDSNRRVIIDVGGNKIRVIVQYKFFINLKKQKRTRFYIKWIGSHSEYDKLCKKNLQYSIDIY